MSREFNIFHLHHASGIMRLLISRKGLGHDDRRTR